MTEALEPTVASEAIARGEPALATSFRFHRPRGPICAAGHCAQCEIASASGNVLACELPASGAINVHAPGRLRLLGRAAELVSPWFYERRFLRPRFLRRGWLHLLRHLSAAPALGPARARPRPLRRFVETAADVVVVGDADGHEGALRLEPNRGDVIVGIYPERVIGVLRGDDLLAVRFERLVLATGCYERLPPVPGCDLPGVLGVDAFDRYAGQGAIRGGTRVAAWAPSREHPRVRRLVERAGAELVWLSERCPERIEGSEKVMGIVAEGRVACELFLTGVRQPALELALQAGAQARLTEGELPILVVSAKPDWLEIVGAAAAQASDVPDVPTAGAAIVCLCEDVRGSDIRECVAQGFDVPELVKRRTGAMTGPCQGKLCAAALLTALREAGVEPTPTRARPLARPIALGELAADA